MVCKNIVGEVIEICSSAAEIQIKGMLFDVQRFSVHDGPGIRSAVFFKGCPLSCPWCSNPESQKTEKELMFKAALCIGCEKCERACPKKAISMRSPYRVDRNKCNACLECVKVCFSKALEVIGYQVTVSNVISKLSKDNLYYRRSKGGITLTGGEPLYQPTFAKELLKACRSRGWHTALETSGYVSAAAMKEVLPWVDLLLYDIKSMDSQKHYKELGVTNERILRNAQLAAAEHKNIVIRTAVIPKFNDSPKDIESIARYALWLGDAVKGIDLLPYHRLGEQKYEYGAKDYCLKNLRPPAQETMERLKTVIQEQNIPVSIGGSGDLYLKLVK